MSMRASCQCFNAACAGRRRQQSIRSAGCRSTRQRRRTTPRIGERVSLLLGALPRKSSSQSLSAIWRHRRRRTKLLCRTQGTTPVRCIRRFVKRAPARARSAVHGTGAGDAESGRGGEPELRDFTRRFWWTPAADLIVLTLAMFGHRITAIPRKHSPRWALRTVQISMRSSGPSLALSALVVLWAGWPFLSAVCSPSATAAPTCSPSSASGWRPHSVIAWVATIALDLFPLVPRPRPGGRVFRGGCGHRVAGPCSTIVELRARSKPRRR